ncbi:hypothetical protein BS47DRAFT_1369118 [Hydnum rufescens UP504]|uniref:Uncharacterized protein n=1 Tax=Hydnum rufescens UP504 TaxID=1448309 RepID=A0A9P6AE31_9AGAM|nr:hypothetical protein BS47DRAFT_1369118 [Hydnum rufescens UP504]
MAIFMISTTHSNAPNDMIHSNAPNEDVMYNNTPNKDTTAPYEGLGTHTPMAGQCNEYPGPEPEPSPHESVNTPQMKTANNCMNELSMTPPQGTRARPPTRVDEHTPLWGSMSQPQCMKICSHKPKPMDARTQQKPMPIHANTRTMKDNK